MNDFKKTLGRAGKMMALPVGTYILFVILSFTFGSGNFLTMLSLKSSLRSAVFTCLVAWGMSFNLLANRWDYSVGASMILASIIGPRFAEALGLSAGFAVLLCALTGAFFCCIVGLFYVFTRIPSLVVSIGLLLVFEGLTAVFFNGAGVNMVGSPLMNIAKFPYFLIPFAIFLLLCYCLMEKTKFGYDLKAISHGHTVAYNVGISEKRTILLAYTIGGFFVGAAGYFHVAVNGKVWPTLDATSIVTAFANCIPVYIGKVLLRYGNLTTGVLMGSLTLGFINMGLSSLGVSSSMQTLFHGLFLLVFLGLSANDERISKYFESRKIIKEVQASQSADIYN